jgi:hypothetical protein
MHLLVGAAVGVAVDRADMAMAAVGDMQAAGTAGMAGMGMEAGVIPLGATATAICPADTALLRLLLLLLLIPLLRRHSLRRPAMPLRP